MALPRKDSDENPELHVPLAIEIGNLRNHFSTTSIFGAGTPVAAVTPADTNRPTSGDTLVDRRSPLSLDSAFVQQTKEQIRAIVESIATLANAPLAPNDFVHAVLPKIVSAMGATAAALWQQSPDSTWRLLGDFKLPSVLLDSEVEVGVGVESERQDHSVGSEVFERFDFIESQLDAAAHTSASTDEATENQSAWSQPSVAHLSVLNAVARERQPILIPPCEARLTRDRPANPTSELLIYAPLPIPKEQGNFWLQIVQTPSGGPSSQRGYLRFVAQMADLMSDYFRSHRLRVFERDRACLTLAENTMTELAGGTNTKLGVAKLLKAIREHAHSEHAFLLRRESFVGRWRLVGAAGLVDIDRRAEGIGQIERAATTIHSLFKHGGTLDVSQLHEQIDERDPDLTRLINTFAVSELQWIKPLTVDAALPQNANLELSGNPKHHRTRPQRQDVAILLTWAGIDKPPVRCLEQCGLISRLGLSAIQAPWWKNALRASYSNERNALAIANPTTWPQAAKWIVSIVLLSLVFAIPVPIHIHATAILVPLVQQHVYAPMDATVEDVLVKHGQFVKRGDPLLRLKSLSLAWELEQALDQQSRNAQRFEEIKAKLLRETSLSSTERIGLEGEYKTLQGLHSTEMNLMELLQRQVDSLSIVASLDGIVSTWNVQESLKDRPLKTGQWLLSLHQSESPWILEASLPERDAQEFRIAIEDDRIKPIATLISMPQLQLPVRLQLKTLPRIDSGQPVDTPADPGSAVLRLRFEVDAEAIPNEVAIAGATARISIPIGHGPLIWAFGKDFANHVWSRFQLWL